MSPLLPFYYLCHINPQKIMDLLRYFYHPDHLGSSSWITDGSGNAIQHLHYLPFGEDWVDQRNSSWNSPYTFSGKEKDAETGYGYFGARYYDSGLSIWLSVDPMSDKYPNLSPYNYCANNPVMLVDPDGRYWINTFSENLANRLLEIGQNMIDSKQSTIDFYKNRAKEKNRDLKKREQRKINRLESEISEIKLGTDELERMRDSETGYAFAKTNIRGKSYVYHDFDNNTTTVYFEGDLDGENFSDKNLGTSWHEVLHLSRARNNNKYSFDSSTGILGTNDIGFLITEENYIFGLQRDFLPSSMPLMTDPRTGLKRPISTTSEISNHVDKYYNN